jgi:hypothetical protein
LNFNFVVPANLAPVGCSRILILDWQQSLSG